MFDSTAQVIRRVTLAPILAGAMLVYLYAAQPELFGSGLVLLRQLIFLSLFPLLAYPMQPLIPHFRDKGREGQRHLAMLFAFAGYLLNCAVNLCVQAPIGLCLIGLVYLLSGAAILLCNGLFGLRASGHAAGVGAVLSLPVALGCPEALTWSLLLLVLVCWSSLAAQRHTVPQLLGGAAIPMLFTALLAGMLL